MINVFQVLWKKTNKICIFSKSLSWYAFFECSNTQTYLAFLKVNHQKSINLYFLGLTHVDQVHQSHFQRSCNSYLIYSESFLFFTHSSIKAVGETFESCFTFDMINNLKIQCFGSLSSKAFLSV